MKNKDLIIKIALGVSTAAVLFSVVTLIRAIIIHSLVVFPIIQVIGSIAIAGICYYLFKMLRGANSEEESEEDQSDELTDSEQEPEKPVDEKTDNKKEEEIETDTDSEKPAESEASDDKDDDYHFSNFMK